jgi:hypothetical protein
MEKESGKEKDKKSRSANKPKNPQDWVEEFGLDINRRNHIFEYDSRLEEWWCNWCRMYYPYSLFFVFLEFVFLLIGQTRIEFLDVPSKATQKIVLWKHFNSKIHQYSSQNEGYWKGKQSELTMDKFSRPFWRDTDLVAGHFRLSYTLFMQGVPFSKHLYIHRAFVSWCGDESKKRIGHFSNESIRQILCLTSNNLRGFFRSLFQQVKYAGLQFDHATDCTQLSHLLAFARIFFPPPSIAPPSGLKERISYTDSVEWPTTPVDCVRCGRSKSTVYVLCSNNHATCSECVVKMVSFFHFFFLPFLLSLFLSFFFSSFLILFFFLSSFFFF